MSATPPSYTPEAVLSIAWRRKWQILMPALAIGAAAAWWIHGLPDRYRSDTLLLVVPQRVPETFVRSTVATRGDARLQSITQQILSRTQLEQIIRDFDLYADRRGAAVMEEIVDSMRTRDIEIQATKGDTFRLSFVADDPDVARRVTGRLASLFIGQTSSDRAALAEGADEFLEAQLEDARRKVEENEAQLEAYRRRHNGELPKQLEANVQGLHSTEMQLQALADSLNRDRERQAVVERSIKDANLTGLLEASAAARPQRPDPQKAPGAAPTATEQLASAESALTGLQSTRTEAHPDVVAMKQAVQELRKQAALEQSRRPEPAETAVAERLRRSRVEELQTELAAIERQIAQKTSEGERLRGVLAAYQRRIEAEPAREAELAALTRDYDTLQQTYRGLLTKKQESQIAANLEKQQIGAQFKVLDPARLPERPFAPNRQRLYAMGAVAAIGIGLALAMLLELFDRGLRTEDDVQAALGVPVLAAAVDTSSDARLISHPEADPLFVEQYRRLGAALHQAQLQSEIRSVMVTSAVDGEGKTLSATNLALTLSRSFGKRVLLVDADLRKPAVHELLELANVFGFSDVLGRPGGRLPGESISSTLTVVTGGRPATDPVSLLASETARRFFADMRERYDWLIVDTPPVALFPDAGLIADAVDTCVTVVRAGATAAPLAAKAVAAIGATRILGAVLNRAEPASLAAGYGYGYGRYGYRRRGRRLAWRLSSAR